MWPFSRKKSQADQAFEIMDAAVSDVAAKYRYFREQLPFSDGMIKESLTAFMLPMREGLRNNFPVLKLSPDDVVDLYIILGIAKSGRHTTPEIAEALNMELTMLESMLQ